MSAKGRSAGAASGTNDYFPTPAWCVRELLRRCPDLPTGYWREPAVGSGAIVRAVEEVRPGRQVWLCSDIREDTRREVADLVGPNGPISSFQVHDFLADGPGEFPADVFITNPPFTMAEEFATEFIQYAKSAAILLLRIGFLGSKERVPFWAANAADIYPLCPRPSFSPDGRTDASEYMWVVWTPETRARGYSRILHPKEPAQDAARRARA